MSVETVRNYLKQWNAQDRIMEFPVSSASVAEAALAIPCEEKEIAKTMSFKMDDRAILIVTAGDAKIDNAKYKAAYHKKAAMLKSDELEPMTGHPAGGVCPFATKAGVTVYLDESLKRFAKVYPACGSTNSAIELSLEELETYSGYQEWVDVCKDWK